DLFCPVKKMYSADGSLIPEELWKNIGNTPINEKNGIARIFELHNGKRKDVMIYPELLLDENGETEGMINCIIDVSAQVEAQKEFENVAKVIEQLYRNAPAFICTLRGTDHIYELVNPAYQNMLGKNGLSGKKFFDANPELRDQSIYKLL